MTMRQFVKRLCQLAQLEERLVYQIDFEPSKNGPVLVFKYR